MRRRQARLDITGFPEGQAVKQIAIGIDHG
jgi:hypothetical protein